MTNEMFSVVGVSTLAGKTKIRFANDMARVKILIKNGHQDVDFVSLAREMTKAEIAQHLTSIEFGAGRPEVIAAIAYVAKKNPAVLSAVVETVVVAGELVSA